MGRQRERPGESAFPHLHRAIGLAMRATKNIVRLNIQCSYHLILLAQEMSTLPPSWAPDLCRFTTVRVRPCILDSALFQRISDASPKLFHIVGGIMVLCGTRLYTPVL